MISLRLPATLGAAAFVLGACSANRHDVPRDSAASGDGGNDASISIPCDQFAADPNVGCAGTFAEGDAVTLTLTGSFGTKPNGAAPLYAWDFSRGSSTIPESRIAKPAPGYGSLAADLVAPGSTGAWKHPVDRDFHDGTYVGGLEVNSRDLYIFARMYFSFDGQQAYKARQDYYGGSCATNGDACWNQKGWRYWHEFTHDWVMGYGDNDPAGNPRWGFSGASSTYDGSMYPRQWHTQDVLVHQSSGVDVADGWSQVAFNGRAMRSSNEASRTSARPEPLSRLHWFQVERTGWTPADGHFYSYDIVYIDDSFHRIVLTDQATWDETTEHRVEIQIPVAWSADAITFKVRRPFQGAHVWAVLADATPVRLGQLP